MQAKCYIHGSFMNDNFGDYLLYDITARAIAGQLPEDAIVSADIAECYDPLTIVNRESKRRAIRTCSMAVLTGGGYFGEPNKKYYREYWHVRFLIKHALPLARLAKRGIPYLIVGLGAGPLKWGISRRLAKYVFDRAEAVYLRDEESRRFVKDVLKCEREIHILPDMVIGCDIEHYITETEWARGLIGNAERKCMAIHLTTKSQGDMRGHDLVIEDIKAFERAHPNEWQYYIECDQGTARKTERAQRLAEQLSECKVTVVPYENPNKLFSLLGEMDIVLTDKLHVGIVSTRLNRYVVSVAAHNKTKRFYDQIGRGEYTKRMNCIEAGDVFALLEAYSGSVSVEAIAPIVNESAKNTQVIRDFVGRHAEGIE